MSDIPRWFLSISRRRAEVAREPDPVDVEDAMPLAVRDRHRLQLPEPGRPAPEGPSLPGHFQLRALGHEPPEGLLQRGGIAVPANRGGRPAGGAALLLMCNKKWSECAPGGTCRTCGRSAGRAREPAPRALPFRKIIAYQIGKLLLPVSPAEFIRTAVRHTIGAAESGDESYIEMLREG